MNQFPIGSLDQPVTPKVLHDLMRELAAHQKVTENMLITSRHGGWHLALSKLRKKIVPEHKNVLRRMAGFVLDALGREKEDGEDAGSILVEDLPLEGPQSTQLRDVVVSWGGNPKDLEKEVQSIRNCLNTLGIFDEHEFADVEVHADTGDTVIGQFGVRYENKSRQVQMSAKLKLQAVLGALGHYVPGLGKADIGGQFSMRIPFQDTREKFIAAMLALQLQSRGDLAECAELCHERDQFPHLSADELQQDGARMVHKGRAYLDQTLATLDEPLRRAFQVGPRTEIAEMYYERCLQALADGRISLAIADMESLKHVTLPIQKAMGENYYLFAATVIMQVQLTMFEQDLDKTLQDRFGVQLLKVASSPGEKLAVTNTSAPVDPSPNPPAAPAFLRRGPRP